MDSFSRLPDEVLCHILSFNTTKEAALTSVLSKRWRNLFAFVPNLDIDDSVFLHPEEGKRERDGILKSFMDFVDRVLDLQGNSPIKKFSLKSKTGVDKSLVNYWICNALQRSVSELDIFISFPTYPGIDSSLPRELLFSRTVVKLKLRSEYILSWWTGDERLRPFLPLLKTLYLESMELHCDQFRMLLHGCPVLENLEMVDVEWMQWDESVSSASLKALKLNSETGFEKFSFDTPSLVFLDYSKCVALDYPVVNLENLVDARINLLVDEEQIQRAREPDNDWPEVGCGDVVRRFSNAKKLMCGVRNVKKLYLSSSTLEVLALCCEAMPVFNNLTILAISSHEDMGWQAMPVLLKNCPNLETLAISGLLHYVTDKCGDACVCINREDKGRSLKSCPVKKLQITWFRGTIRELKMIKHFLLSFPCLKVMKIFAEENGPTDFEVPGIFERVVAIIDRCNELSSCDVKFVVPHSLYKKWTAQ